MQILNLRRLVIIEDYLEDFIETVPAAAAAVYAITTMKIPPVAVLADLQYFFDMLQVERRRAPQHAFKEIHKQT